MSNTNNAGGINTPTNSLLNVCDKNTEKKTISDGYTEISAVIVFGFDSPHRCGNNWNFDTTYTETQMNVIIWAADLFTDNPAETMLMNLKLPSDSHILSIWRWSNSNDPSRDRVFLLYALDVVGTSGY